MTRRPSPAEMALLQGEIHELRAADVEVVPVRTVDGVEHGSRPAVGVVDDGWRLRASCRGHPQAWWWFSPDRTAMNLACAVCAQCPVAGPCLVEAMAEEATLGELEVYGIRGGVSASQRLTLAGRGSIYRRRRRRAVS